YEAGLRQRRETEALAREAVEALGGREDSERLKEGWAFNRRDYPDTRFAVLVDGTQARVSAFISDKQGRHQIWVGPVVLQPGRALTAGTLLAALYDALDAKVAAGDVRAEDVPPAWRRGREVSSLADRRRAASAGRAAAAGFVSESLFREEEV